MGVYLNPENQNFNDQRYEFDVMLKNQLVAKARISNRHYHVEINPEIPKSLQVFAMENPNDYHVYEFLKSRCYDDERADLKEILEQTGLSHNNPFLWCRITHGFMLGDYYWIRFTNESLTWEDIKND